MLKFWKNALCFIIGYLVATEACYFDKTRQDIYLTNAFL